MTSVVAKASSGTASQLLPTMPVREKGSRNKRKFRADPLVDPNKMESLFMNEFSSYEFSSEKSELTHSHGHPCDCNMCNVSEGHADDLKLDLGLSTLSQPQEETEATNDSHDADWSDLTESQLEELVLSNLDTIIKGAIKQVVDCGYNEEVAKNAVLRSGLCHVFKVTASNICENAMAYLKSGQGNDGELYFDDLKQMAKYILAELVCVLREVRPVFSTGDAMWCLLVSDMSLSHACAMDIDTGSSVTRDENNGENNSDQGNGVIPDENVGENDSDHGCSVIPDRNLSVNSSPVQARFTSETKIPGLDLPNPCKQSPLPRCAPTCQCGKAAVFRGSKSLNLKGSLDLSGLNLEKEISGSSGKIHSHGRDDKYGASKKVSGITKKEYILRQKSIHFERSFRTYSCKGFSRTTKISAFGGLIVDKKPKSAVDSCVSIKNVSLKISKSMGVDVPCDKKTHNLLTKVGFPSPLDINLEKVNTVSTSPKASILPETKVTNAPALSAADTELSLSLPTNVETSISPLEQSVPHGNKDDMILKLVPKSRELQNQLQEWTEWANQKIMQAARRLSKDKAELKTLRQERDEMQKLKREKQTLEENTMKKLSEMENALYKTSGQVKRANASLHRLEGENIALRQGMEAAKLRAVESAASCNEVSKREKKTMMQFQSWEKEKVLLQEELVAVKRKVSHLLQEIQQAEDRKNKLEARWKMEENAKEELLLQARTLRKERLQIEASAKSKEDMINSRAQSSQQKYKDDIGRLEREISQLRLKTESTKIDALRRGINGSYSSKISGSKCSKMPLEVKGSLVIGGVKRERECVMCLSEEMSIVFLPCAHQVVCRNCNNIHEKQGMKDCPSCRSPIQRRISVLYAHS